VIEPEGWLDLLTDLVRTPSHPGVPRQEEAVVRVLSGWLAAHGIASEISEVAPGRPNLLARVAGRDAGRRLVLCGHTDTVPLNVGDEGVGFRAEVRDGRLFGRGACDMKGALAAMAATLVSLAATGGPARGELVLAAVADEEMESRGAEALVASGFRADGAIVGEPTQNHLALGHRGLEWLEISFTGKAAHGGTPEAGINAIVAASRFLVLVEERLKPALAKRAHPLIGPPTINAGTIAGGDQPSTVAGACAVRVDRRTVPGESYGSVVAELEALVVEVAGAVPGIRASIARVPGGMLALEHLPTVLGEDHPLARTVAAACGAERGRRDEPASFPAWTDASLLANFAGIPCVILGPGDLALAHSPAESVPLAEVREAARIYARAAADFCGA
jgi:acetylornithine deacetylase/succinyl-diaminopimelate desuccinylase